MTREPVPDTLGGALRPYLGQRVVLDTAGTIVYLGTLREVLEAGFWLEDAEIHDCRDGHANKESYVYETRTDGIRPNRRRIFVMRDTVISASGLEEVVDESGA